MAQKAHLTDQGLQKIINIRASLNLALSESLKAAFLDTVLVSRPFQPLQEIPDPEWVAGFVTGEGCFFVKILKDRNRFGVGVELIFQVTQHTRDEALMKSLVTYFKCGRYDVPGGKNWGHFLCTIFSDNYNIILPFLVNTWLEVQKLKISRIGLR